MSLEKHSSLSPLTRKQKSLKGKISFSGSGLFTGEKATLTLLPGEADTGVVFVRTDLAGSPFFRTDLSLVKQIPLCTVLGNGLAQVQTVEHLLAAFRAYEIDNIRVEVSGPEIPIGDGSSLPFIKMIEEVGVAELDAVVRVHTLAHPVYFSKDDVHLVALPSDEYRISYTLHYPNSKLLQAQYYSYVLGDRSFKEEIAPCRTFSFYEEIAPMIDKGLLKGGILENAVLIKEDVVLNKEGTRFSNEMVRHKILDMIGDFSLVGVPFLAHIVAIRSGHASNHAFAKLLLNHLRENL